MEPNLSRLLHEKEKTILSMQSSLEEGEKEKLRLDEQLKRLMKNGRATEDGGAREGQ